MMVTTEPGVRTIDLYNYCAKKDCSIRPTRAAGNIPPLEEMSPKMPAVCGPLIRSNQNYVIGLEVVLADGKVLRLAARR